jgi:polar amino acid transport system substrate-binding protein
MKKRLVALALIVVFAVAVFAGCAAAPTPSASSAAPSASVSPSVSTSASVSPSESTSASVSPSESAVPSCALVDAVKKKGELVVGCEALYPPFEYHKLVDGKDEIVGSDVELGKIIAEKLGVKWVPSDLGFDTLVTALNTNKVDMIISAMEPKEERKETADFTEAYYDASSSIIIRKEDEGTFTTIDSLKGKKVGAQLGSTQEDILKTQMKDSTPITQQKEPEMIIALKSKKLDGIVVDTLVAENYVKANPDLALSTIKLENVTAGYAIAINKGSSEFVTYLNGLIKELSESGQIQQMIDKANADSAAE